MNEEIDRASKADIIAFQERKLREQLAFVDTHSPYYQRLFIENKIDIQHIQTIKDLQGLPVTSKEQLQRYNDDFLCVPQSKIIDYSSTSGTTGKPVNFGLTENDLERLAYNEANSFHTIGISENDVVQLMTTMDRRFMAGLAYFLGLKKLGASVIRTGAGIPALQWESILSMKPTYLIAVPSFLLKLIHFAENNGIDLKSTSVKGALCIGEPLREQNLQPNSLAKRINEKWDIRLFSTYASTEMSTAFTECERQEGGHAHPSLIITELLDAKNRPVKRGEIGELTITTLGIEGMPLVRFKTGDLLKMYDEPCSCGRKTPRVGPVLGRAKQMVKYKGTTLFPPAIQEVINHFSEINEHIIELNTNEFGNDEVLVKLVCENRTESFLKQLKEAFQAKIRVVPGIKFIDYEMFNQLAFSSSSRKTKWVIDNRRK